MKPLSLKIAVFLLVGNLFLVAPAVWAAETPVEMPSSVPAVTMAIKPTSLLAAVSRARELLLAEMARQNAADPKPATYRSTNVPRNITLAVWNRDTDAIELVPAVKTGSSLKFPTAPAPPIKVALDSGLTSRYVLPPESHSLVVGVIFPYLTATKVKKATVYVPRRTVYASYAQDFYTPEVLTAGSDYLTNRVQSAFDDLRARGIKSRAFPDQLLADAIDPYLIKSIIVIEHASPASLLQADSPEDQLGYFYVNLALNQEETFDHAVSTAGASGLAQFIPSTYKLFVKNRPDLGLIADFAAGMADHTNAIKAEIAYLDQALAEMPTGLKQLYSSDAAQAAEFLAAAYNGGTSRVKKAYGVWGSDWAMSRQMEIQKLTVQDKALVSDIEAMKAKLKKTKDAKQRTKLNNSIWSQRAVRQKALARLAVLNSSSLRQETVLYVAKCRKVYALLTSGVFATPNAPSGALPEKMPTALAVVLAPAICFSDGGCAITD